MFNARYFTYDGVWSGDYGLELADFENDTVSETDAFTPNLSVLKAPSLVRFFHGGVEYDSAPTCTFSISGWFSTMRNWHIRSPACISVGRVAYAGNIHWSPSPQYEPSIMPIWLVWIMP